MADLIRGGAQISEVIFVMTTCIVLIYLVLMVTTIIAGIDYRFKYNKQLFIAITCSYIVGGLFAIWSVIFGLSLIILTGFALKFVVGVMRG